MWEVRQPLQGHTERMFDRNAAANKKGRKVAFHSFLFLLLFLHWIPTVSLKNIHNKLSFMYLISQTSIFYKREWVVEYVCTKEKYVWKRSADLCQVHCIHQTNHLSLKGGMLFRNNLNKNNQVRCYLVNKKCFKKIIYFGNWFQFWMTFSFHSISVTL